MARLLLENIFLVVKLLVNSKKLEIKNEQTKKLKQKHNSCTEAKLSVAEVLTTI